jgi:hypothetical protein
MSSRLPEDSVLSSLSDVQDLLREEAAPRYTGQPPEPEAREERPSAPAPAVPSFDEVIRQRAQRWTSGETAGPQAGVQLVSPWRRFQWVIVAGVVFVVGSIVLWGGLAVVTEPARASVVPAVFSEFQVAISANAEAARTRAAAIEAERARAEAERQRRAAAQAAAEKKAAEEAEAARVEAEKARRTRAAREAKRRARARRAREARQFDSLLDGL